MAGGEQPNRAVPLYQNDLAQAPLPDILLKVHRYKVPGVIECRRGAETAHVWIDDGRIIFASTSRRTEPLGHKLIREGRVTAAQLEESIRQTRITGMLHGVTLVNMGLLTRDELTATVRAQLEEIIDAVFEWTDGIVAFTPGRDKEKALELVKLDLSLPNAIVRGVRHMRDARALVARLGDKATLLQRTDAQYADLHLADDEQRLLALVDGRRTLYELVRSTPDQGLNARLLYAFFALQLIVRREKKQVKVQIRTEAPKE